MRTSLFPCLAILITVGLLTAADPPRPTEPDPELVYAERVLKDANVAVDGSGLIAFFKARTRTPAVQQRITAAVGKLGDDHFEVRERASNDLIAAGRIALPDLRQALKSQDIEVVSRARRCMEEIERVPESTLVSAAARLIAVKRPESATEALLDCLPSVEDEAAQEALFQALVHTGLKDGAAAPVVTAAAKDKEPVRRAAAAFVLGRGNATVRRAAIPLLTDADARVRFHAAGSLVRAGDRTAVPALFALLNDGPTSLAWRAEDLLYLLAGDKAPLAFIGAGDETARRKARAAWTAWWKENGDKIDLTKVNMDEASQRLTLVVESEGRIWECNPDGTPRWEIKVTGQALDARVLPGNRVLVAEHDQGRVTERDSKGQVLWEHRVPNPVVCQRLSNGNTFIASYQNLREVTPDGKVLYTHPTRNGMIYHAEKLRDGHILYVTSGNTICELDANGKLDKTVSTNVAGTTSGWASVERLTNGNYLVALYSNNKVVELDGAGKVLWDITARSPGHATRLRNGNTLVASIEGRTIVEYDKAGKEVWSVKAPGRPFHAWRR